MAAWNSIDDESHILSVLEEIRQSLYMEGNMKEIELDLESMEHNKDYAGFCDVLYSDWSISDIQSTTNCD